MRSRKLLFVVTAVSISVLLGALMSAGTTAHSQTKPEIITIERGSTRSISKGKLSIRFVELVEDSRCPPDAQCVWAGNARVKIAVARGRSAFVGYELNSNGEPSVVKVGGYEIRFADLKSGPGEEPSDAIVKPTLSLELKRVK